MGDVQEKEENEKEGAGYTEKRYKKCLLEGKK